MKTKLIICAFLFISSTLASAQVAQVKSRIVGEASCLYWGDYYGQKAVNEVFAVYTVLFKRNSSRLKTHKIFKDGYVPCHRLKDEDLKNVCKKDEDNSLKLQRVKDLVQMLEHEEGYDSKYAWTRDLEVKESLKDCLRDFRRGY